MKESSESDFGSLSVSSIKIFSQFGNKNVEECTAANSNPIISSSKMTNAAATLKPRKKRKAHFNLFLRLSESQLLEVYSFLQTMEVVNAAQVCRAVFARVDSLFGMESGTVRRPEWEREATDMMRELEDIEREEKSVDGGIRGEGEGAEVQDNSALPATSISLTSPAVAVSTPNPTAPASSSSSSFSMSMSSFSLTSPSAAAPSDSNGGTGKSSISREMVEALTKKLNPQELKYVLSISEQLKKRQQQIDVLEADKIKLQERLGFQNLNVCKRNKCTST